MYNKQIQQKQKEQAAIKKFNKSEEGKDLLDKVRKLRDKHYPINK